MFTRSQAKNRRTEHDFLLGRSWRCGGFFCFMGCCVIVAPGTRRTVSCPGCWWIPGAVPLSSRKNAKGGEQGTQLACGSNKCPLSSNAFSCEPRGSQAPCTKRPCPKTHRRCALAVWKIAYQRGVLTGARRSYVFESEGLKSRSISKISKIRWIACWWFKGEGLRAGRKM